MRCGRRQPRLPPPLLWLRVLANGNEHGSSGPGSVDSPMLREAEAEAQQQDFHDRQQNRSSGRQEYELHTSSSTSSKTRKTASYAAVARPLRRDAAALRLRLRLLRGRRSARRRLVGFWTANTPSPNSSSSSRNTGICRSTRTCRRRASRARRVRLGRTLRGLWV
ncbi:hypothetical protein BDZ97DRAFT_1795286 [Flammula alnicola]|nr:hypothetical protein BDZ97DRAFT_1795286 [Flammula alnicola]